MTEGIEVHETATLEPGGMSAAGAAPRAHRHRHQIVLVFQGGGALGAYQGGVYQALHEAGLEPDWIIGTSIGAINASLITGNKPQDRLVKLKEFWQRVDRATFWGSFPA